MHLLSPLLSLCLLILPLPPSSTLFPYTTLFRSSAMAAPAGLYLSKILLPEKEVPVTRGDTGSTTESTHANVVDAAASGASEGMMLALNVAAMLIAFLSLLALADYLLGLAHQGLSLS